MAQLFFFFNDTATTEIYTLSLHDALPILVTAGTSDRAVAEEAAWTATLAGNIVERLYDVGVAGIQDRKSHTSELQSRLHLVCRLLLEKKKKNPQPRHHRLHDSSTPASVAR